MPRGILLYTETKKMNAIDKNIASDREQLPEHPSPNELEYVSDAWRIPMI